MRQVERTVLFFGLMLFLLLLPGCPVTSGPERTDVEREAMRVVQALRAALAEVELFVDGIDAALTTPEELCRWLRTMRDDAGSYYATDLAVELPEAWFDETGSGSGLYGGYRFILVREGGHGVYALPEPPGPKARTVFYAALPAGLFHCMAENFQKNLPVQPPDVENNPAWRPVQIIK